MSFGPPLAPCHPEGLLRLLGWAFLALVRLVGPLPSLYSNSLTSPTPATEHPPRSGPCDPPSASPC